MLQISNNEIYQSFINKMGSDWYTPFNSKKYMTCGEFTLCADLYEYGLLERIKENGIYKFKKKNK